MLLLLAWIKIQVVEDQLVTSSGCHWVCQWQQQWTVLITLVQRTFTSSPLRESRVVWTVCLLLALVIWLWPLSRRESLISGRRSCLLSSLGSASLGAERTVFSCTSKVIHFPLLFYFSLAISSFIFSLSGVYSLQSMFIFFLIIGSFSFCHILIYAVIKLSLILETQDIIILFHFSTIALGFLSLIFVFFVLVC